MFVYLSRHPLGVRVAFSGRALFVPGWVHQCLFRQRICVNRVTVVSNFPKMTA